MKKTELLTIKLNDRINLHLIIKISETKREITMLNEELNISCSYKNINLKEAKKLYAKLIIESIIKYAKNGILAKIINSSKVRIKFGNEWKNEIIKNIKEVFENT